MYMVYEIDIDGTVRAEAKKSEPSYAALRDYIGCRTVERANVLYEGAPCTLYVDEDGLPKELPPNEKATSVYANALLQQAGLPTYDNLLQEPEIGAVFYGDRMLIIVGRAVLVQQVRSA